MPSVAVFAGINGAGKSTASRRILTDVLRIKTFVNADTIARGLSELDPESQAMAAGRVMLAHMKDLAARQADFAFETTLAARTYAGWLAGLRDAGYDVLMYYFWLDSPDRAIERVAARVRAGGHHIPEATIRRRYTLSVRNFFELYRPVCAGWRFYDNSGAGSRMIAVGDADDGEVYDQETWPEFRSLPAMSRATTSRLDAMRAESAKVQAALDAATRDALLEHARMGRTVPVTGPDGATRQAPPAEIFARYGLDEFGRPAG